MRLAASGPGAVYFLLPASCFSHVRLHPSPEPRAPSPEFPCCSPVRGFARIGCPTARPSHLFETGFAGGLFMLQRQPRVGDIVDDYCPRERRVSDHAVVAMVGDGIRQTRCTTCDTEHEYRQAKVPPGRKKSAAALAPKPPAAAPSVAVPKPPELASEPEGSDSLSAAGVSAPAPEPAPGPGPGSEAPLPAHEGHVHRRLIRAVLPRIEGETPTRQAPEFTMHRPVGQRPTPPGRPPRQGHSGPPRHGSGGVTGHSRHPGSRATGGGPSAGTRGGRGGQNDHAGQPNRSGSRHGRPQQGGQGQRKKH